MTNKEKERRLSNTAQFSQSDYHLRNVAKYKNLPTKIQKFLLKNKHLGKYALAELAINRSVTSPEIQEQIKNHILYSVVENMIERFKEERDKKEFKEKQAKIDKIKKEFKEKINK